MKKLIILGLACITALTAVSWVEATGPSHTKVMPYSLGYPLIRSRPFPTPLGDVYQAQFGVRRVLSSVVNADFDATLIEVARWHDLYGGYGVLGHGESVFTNRAARYRKMHQGR